MSAPPAPARPAHWTSRRSLLAHGALLIWVPGCVAATWWQVTVGLSGDNLGWVYSVMWPFFAVFSVVVWWNIVHDDPETVGARGSRRMREVSVDHADTVRGARDDAIARAEAEDEELAAYNAYLAELQRAHPKKGWRQR